MVESGGSMKCSLAQDKSPCLSGKEGAARAGGNNLQKMTNRWELEHTGPQGEGEAARS